MFRDIINFFKGKQEQKNNSQKRSPFIWIICIIAIIIPTLFAIFYAYFYEDTEKFSSAIASAELYDADGNILHSDEITQADIATSPFVYNLHNLVNSKKQVSTPESLDMLPNYKIAVSSPDDAQTYLCYFTSSASESYIKDSNDVFFTFDEEPYIYFLNSDYSETAYSELSIASLFTNYSQNINPYSAEWKYRRQDETFVSAQSTNVSNKINTYHLSGAIDLHFDRMPDICTVEIYSSDGTSVFKGDFNELPSVTAKIGEVLDVGIQASWERHENAVCYGIATYKFKIILDSQATFSTSSTEVSTGSFVSISADNITNPSGMVYTVESEPSFEDTTPEQKAALQKLYAFKPKFVFAGKQAMTIIPIPLDTPETSFEFSLSFGAVKQHFKINILKQQEPSLRVYPNSESELELLLSDKSQSSFKNAISSLTPYVQELIFFRNEFSSPADYGFSLGFSFRNRLYSASNADFYLDSMGNEYYSTNGKCISVRTLNIGAVIECGSCDYLGNYVVLEHGAGLRTWYCGLGSIDVSCGDILEAGDIVGKSGNSLLTSTEGFFLMCTVYDTVISPDSIVGIKP